MGHGEAIFDDIADYYDSTRTKAKTVEIDAIADALGVCRSVLEIGIGTGRIAEPLQERGFQIT